MNSADNYVLYLQNHKIVTIKFCHNNKTDNSMYIKTISGITENTRTSISCHSLNYWYGQITYYDSFIFTLSSMTLSLKPLTVESTIGFYIHIHTYFNIVRSYFFVFSSNMETLYCNTETYLWKMWRCFLESFTRLLCCVYAHTKRSWRLLKFQYLSGEDQSVFQSGLLLEAICTLYLSHYL